MNASLEETTEVRATQEISKGLEIYPILFMILVPALVASILFNLTLLKTNSYLLSQQAQLQQQTANLDKGDEILNLMIQDLANFSSGHPEVRSILANYGITISYTNPAVPQPPAPK